MKLLSFPSFVESPFISIDINGVKFGSPVKSTSGKSYTILPPNYMESMTVTKINGSVNMYTISMVYPIDQFTDPNYLENVFASVGPGGRMKISYGDYSSPNYSFLDEEVILTKVTSRVDFSNSVIHYELSCTSTSLPALSTVFDFPARFAQPSVVARELFLNSLYGLQAVFIGMTAETLSKFIPSNDKVVKIEAKRTSIGSYLSYLAECMVSTLDVDSLTLHSSKFFLKFENTSLGQIFKFVEILANSNKSAYGDIYEIDVGFPGNNFVTGFNISEDESYSFLYKYTNDIKQANYVYQINDRGEMETVYSPCLTTNSSLRYTTEATKSWWTQVTKFPINATLTIKGLIKPVLLMEYVKLNVVFYGNKHISTGVYTITKQVDSVSSAGYTTTLSLIRVDGDA